jgi:hypothetical protein
MHTRRLRRGGEAPDFGVSDEPLTILKGQDCELREVGGQVRVVQRDAVRDTPAPPDPHENSQTDFRWIPAVSAGGRKDQHACNSEGGVQRRRRNREPPLHGDRSGEDRWVIA